MKNFVKKFTDEEISDVVKIGRKYFQVSEEMQKVLGELKINRDPEHAGIFLGEKIGKEFSPGMGLLDIIGKMTTKKAVIDEKSEWLFLCDRDVFKDSVIKCNVQKGFVLVMNKKDEVLGYGIVQKGNVMIENKLDRGDFLRREMSTKVVRNYKISKENKASAK